ncbi:MAG: hypothetical protein U9P70_00830 [Patescibacteria group bacterium]|nr:hypothetical protein [Patescibacteria group bacterium]
MESGRNRCRRSGKDRDQGSEIRGQRTEGQGQRSEIRSRKSAGKWDQRLNIRHSTSDIQCRMVGGKVSEDLFERGLCLPSGTAMTEEYLDRAVDTILNCRKKAQKTQE